MEIELEEDYLIGQLMRVNELLECRNFFKETLLSPKESVNYLLFDLLNTNLSKESKEIVKKEYFLFNNFLNELKATPKIINNRVNCIEFLNKDFICFEDDLFVIKTFKDNMKILDFRVDTVKITNARILKLPLIAITAFIEVKDIDFREKITIYNI